MSTEILVHTARLSGIEAVRVPVRARAEGRDLTIRGLSSEAATREARVRVLSALAAAGIEIVHCATVDVENAQPSTVADLAIAVAVALVGDGKPPPARSVPTLVGELSLGGALRPVRGVYSIVRDLGPTVLAPFECAAEVAAGGGALVSTTLREVVAYLKGDAPHGVLSWHGEPLRGACTRNEYGQPTRDATKAAVDAIVESPRTLLVGPPGSGRVLAARLAREHLGMPSPAECDAIARIHSAGGIASAASWTHGIERPLRAPHHTVSEAGLIGGGLVPRPGEVSLAHGGMLVLDDVTEFRGLALEAVAHAMREGAVRLGGLHGTVTFPARPMRVVATAAACPCGQRWTDRCHCATDRVERWEARLAAVQAKLDLKRVEVKP